VSGFRGAAIALLSAAAGFVVAWMMFGARGGDDLPDADAATEQRRASGLRDEPTAAADTSARAAPVSDVPTATAAIPPAVDSVTAAPAAATRNPIVADIPPRDLPITRTDLPNRRDGDPAARKPAAALLDSTRITCDFGAGNNTGLRFGDTLSVGGGAQWQGGLLIYDLVDAAAGAVRLTGTAGATGSQRGEAKMQVTTEGSRVLLSGFLENRAFLAVTIFDELDNFGRHIAVMSRHEGFFELGSQFLGTCE
jgi:hypothetical protein